MSPPQVPIGCLSAVLIIRIFRNLSTHFKAGSICHGEVQLKFDRLGENPQAMFPCIVYSPETAVRLPVLSLAHSFDVRAHGRAFQKVSARFGPALEGRLFSPTGECNESDLLRVHDRHYLNSLSSGAILAGAFDLFWIRLLPMVIRQRCIIHPLLVAVQGTILAVELALQHGLVFHIGGGFHHAHRSKAEGYCIFADAVIAIRSAQAKGLLRSEDCLIYIDLDAHIGNGVFDLLQNDRAVYGIDIFNSDMRTTAPAQISNDNWRFVPVAPGCDDDTYLHILECELITCLRSSRGPKLAIYNAGSDVVAGDPLGRLGLTAGGVVRRDKVVIDALTRAGIPTVILASGGYTSATPSLIAGTVAYLFENYDTLAPSEQWNYNPDLAGGPAHD
jgi:histone deacetylase 11